MEEVESIGDLLHKIASRIDADKRILWFRGHHSVDWGVQPTIWRDYDNEEERNFTHRFRSRAGMRYSKTPSYKNYAGWLGLMQHYGLPTRLLDWTRSPLVALYFALEPYLYEDDITEKDACVWILEPHILNDREGFGEYTPAIDGGKCQRLLGPAFLHDAEEPNNVVAAMAAETDVRMFVQQGAFTVHSYRNRLNERDNHGDYLSAFKIPSAHVKQIAFELDVGGFRKGDLFPDLQNLADELKGRYRLGSRR